MSPLSVIDRFGVTLNSRLPRIVQRSLSPIRSPDGRWVNQPSWLSQLPAMEKATLSLIGAVMKQMRGQADAARVRELILDRLQPRVP